MAAPVRYYELLSFCNQHASDKCNGMRKAQQHEGAKSRRKSSPLLSPHVEAGDHIGAARGEAEGKQKTTRDLGVVGISGLPQTRAAIVLALCGQTVTG